MGCYGDAFSDITIVLALMHGNVDNLSPGEQQQQGAFQIMPSDLVPSDLWSDSGNERQIMHKSLGFEGEAN